MGRGPQLGSARVDRVDGRGARGDREGRGGPGRGGGPGPGRAGEGRAEGVPGALRGGREPLDRSPRGAG
eukprot:2123800-Pyramimonas_sp.AAC.1